MQTAIQTVDEVELHAKYGINRKWVLRNDTNKLVLHQMSLEDSKYIILPPDIGLALPLFDGKRTLIEVAKLHDLTVGWQNLDASLAICKSAIDEINRHDSIIIPTSISTEDVVAYDPLSLIPDWNQYKFSYRLNRPFRAMVMLTNRCQTDCVYCYAERRCTDEMSKQEWMDIAEQMKSLEFFVIVPSGGDPLARPDSIAILSEFVRAGLVFLISTKCAVSEDAAEELVESGFKIPVRGLRREFQFSLDSADPAIADRMTRTHGYLQRVRNSVCNLLRVGIVPKIKAVMTPLNVNEVEPLVEAFVDSGINSFGFSMYSRSGYRHDDSLFLSDDQKRAIADACQRVREKFPYLYLYGDAVNYIPIPQDTESRTKWREGAICGGGFTSLTITPDGKVILCEQVPETEPFVVGDLRKQTIMEVWNSDKLLEFLHPSRELFKETICYDCEEFDPCHFEKGWCYRDALFAFGTPYAPPPRCPFVENPPRMA